MNVDRLEELAEALLVWPESQWDFNHWVGYTWTGKPDISCGATACALGVATTIPSLRKLGLQLYKPIHSHYGMVIVEGTYFDYNYRFDTSIRSAMHIFDLSYKEAEYLFSPERDLTIDGRELDLGPLESASAKEVAEHIRYFIGAKLAINHVEEKAPDTDRNPEENGQ